jgi:hypothetical protein
VAKRYARNPGEDQVQQWKQALASHRRQQRNQRGRKQDASSVQFRPGMVRITPCEDDSVNEEQAQHLRKLAEEWRDQSEWIRDQPNGHETDRKTRGCDAGLVRPAT